VLLDIHSADPVAFGLNRLTRWPPIKHPLRSQAPCSSAFPSPSVQLRGPIIWLPTNNITVYLGVVWFPRFSRGEVQIESAQASYPPEIRLTLLELTCTISFDLPRFHLNVYDDHVEKGSSDSPVDLACAPYLHLRPPRTREPGNSNYTGYCGWKPKSAR